MTTEEFASTPLFGNSSNVTTGCPGPPLPPHASLQTAATKEDGVYPEGAHILYRCSSGFSLQTGMLNRTCLAGKWSGTPPDCHRDSALSGPEIAWIIICGVGFAVFLVFAQDFMRYRARKLRSRRERTIFNSRDHPRPLPFHKSFLKLEDHLSVIQAENYKYTGSEKNGKDGKSKKYQRYVLGANSNAQNQVPSIDSSPTKANGRISPEKVKSDRSNRSKKKRKNPQVRPSMSDETLLENGKKTGVDNKAYVPSGVPEVRAPEITEKEIVSSATHARLVQNYKEIHHISPRCNVQLAPLQSPEMSDTGEVLKEIPLSKPYAPKFNFPSEPEVIYTIPVPANMARPLPAIPMAVRSISKGQETFEPEENVYKNETV